MKLIISNVRLAKLGGNTEFDITTIGVIPASGQLGKIDEKLAFEDGFRLPGLISSVRQPIIYSEYRRNDLEYPVKSAFEVQMGALGYATFYLRFSTQVEPGQTLSLDGPTYNLQARNFRITKYDALKVDDFYQSEEADDVVPATVVQISGGLVRVVLGGTLVSDVAYAITVSTITPNEISETWRFETSDGGALPTNTNDGVQGPFQGLVAPYVLRVVPIRQSPRARITCMLQIDPLNTVPFQMRIIAPPTLNFTNGDCLADSNQAINIMHCTRMPQMLSRDQAQLQAIQGGVHGPVGVMVEIDTPQSTPAITEWYVEGLSQTGVVQENRF